MIEDGIEHAAESSPSAGAGRAAPKGLKPAFREALLGLVPALSASMKPIVDHVLEDNPREKLDELLSQYIMGCKVGRGKDVSQKKPQGAPKGGPRDKLPSKRPSATRNCRKRGKRAELKATRYRLMQDLYNKHPGQLAEVLFDGRPMGGDKVNPPIEEFERLYSGIFAEFPLNLPKVKSRGDKVAHTPFSLKEVVDAKGKL